MTIAEAHLRRQVRQYIDAQREADTRAIRAYSRGAGDAPVLYRASVAKTVAQTGPVDVVASEESPDRLGDVIMASGWDLEAYARNPVLMWAHDYSRAPIGTAGVGVRGKQLHAAMSFDLPDPFAAEIDRKYRQGFLRAVSVGFRPTVPPKANKSDGWTFSNVELLEISAVPVPAHPAALAKIMAHRLAGRTSRAGTVPLAAATAGIVDALEAAFGRDDFLAFRLSRAIRELGASVGA